LEENIKKILCNSDLVRPQIYAYIATNQKGCDTIMSEGQERTVVHMDLDSFFVSVSCLENTSLKGKPVLVGGSGDRGVVAACSYEARAFGVHSAMPMKLARRLCPDAIIIRGDYDRYSYYSGMVTDIIHESVPVYEKSSIDEFYIDLSGMDRFYVAYDKNSKSNLLTICHECISISYVL
jgi:nucleotidyltransferase/DNA polymerase involved in DNA repair